MSGKVEAFSAIYIEDKQGSENSYNEIRFRPKLLLSGSEGFLLYTEGDFRIDSQNFAEGYMDDIVDQSSRRWIFGIYEAYGEYNKKWLRMRAGYQVYDWSVTDTVSPNDNISPRDFMDIIRWDRITVPSISTRIGYDSFLELVYLPWFTPSKLPVSGSRWAQTLPPGVARGDQNLPSKVHCQFAARAGTVYQGFDLGISFYNGYSYAPSLRQDVISPSSALLIPVYIKETVYAMSIAKDFMGYNFRGELGYFDQRDADKFWQYVVGVDREWSGLLRDVDSFYLLFQYVNEIKSSEGHITGPKLPDFRRVFNDSIMGKISYTFDPQKRWSVKVRGNYNLREGDSFVEPAIAWRGDRVEIEAGVDVMSGPIRSFWGSYKDNDRVFLKMTFSY